MNTRNKGIVNPSGMRVKQALRALAGLLAAFFAAGLGLLVIVGAAGFLVSPETPFSEVWDTALAVAYAGVLIALPVVLVGAPIFYTIFRWFGWITSWQSAAGGAALGALVFPVMVILSGDWQDLFSLEVLGVGLLGAVLGTPGGLVFWWIAVRTLRATERRDTST